MEQYFPSGLGPNDGMKQMGPEASKIQATNDTSAGFRQMERTPNQLPDVNSFSKGIQQTAAGFQMKAQSQQFEQTQNAGQDMGNAFFLSNPSQNVNVQLGGAPFYGYPSAFLGNAKLPSSNCSDYILAQYGNYPSYQTGSSTIPMILTPNFNASLDSSLPPTVQLVPGAGPLGMYLPMGGGVPSSNALYPTEYPTGILMSPTGQDAQALATSMYEHQRSMQEGFHPTQAVGPAGNPLSSGVTGRSNKPTMGEYAPPMALSGSCFEYLPLYLLYHYCIFIITVIFY